MTVGWVTHYFKVTGLYRMQSRSTAEPGSLKGRLVVSAPGMLSSETANKYLERHPHWRGVARVSIYTALLDEREGVFASHDDALYYRDHFVPVDCAAGLEGDLIDLRKLVALYERRLPGLKYVFAQDGFDQIVQRLSDIALIATNEYVLHEIGHRLGYSIEAKFAAGFFRDKDRTMWPLVYAEEYRADLGSWHVALREWSLEEALKIIVYTLAHRFGLAVENLCYGKPGAGIVPYLHFRNLLRSGAVQLEQEGGRCSINLRFCYDRFAQQALAESVSCLTSQFNLADSPETIFNDGSDVLLDHCIGAMSDIQARESFSLSFIRADNM